MIQNRRVVVVVPRRGGTALCRRCDGWKVSIILFDSVLVLCFWLLEWFFCPVHVDRRSCCPSFSHVSPQLCPTTSNRLWSGPSLVSFGTWEKGKRWCAFFLYYVLCDDTCIIFYASTFSARAIKTIMLWLFTQTTWYFCIQFWRQKGALLL